jgi:hypothetical protein
LADRGLMRPLRRFPFVPNTPSRLEEDCYEAFNIQVEGLRKRSNRPAASISSSAFPAGSIRPMR